MHSDLEIWRHARLMIELHGREARGEAAGRADQKLRHNDLKEAGYWNKVAAKIAELQTRTLN